MGEIDKTDIVRIFDKLEIIQVKVGKIEQKMEDAPKPEARPCDFHLDLHREVHDHIDDHKEVKKTWRTKIIGAVVDIVKIAVVCLFGFWIGTK